MSIEILTWFGIGFLVLQSGTFSGLNLAMFGVTSLRLLVLARTGDARAAKLQKMRQDSNFLLTTILWGNVGTNVLLTLLSDSVMAGALAFFFSTFVITFGGEILPQAYFSRHAIRMASLMAPVLRFYQILLYPLAKPSAMILDAWLGKEAVDYLPEDQMREALKAHLRANESDISRIEGRGAINFMDLDDLPLSEEGSPVDPESLVYLPFESGMPRFPDFDQDKDDPFIVLLRNSTKRWVLLAPENEPPKLALDASAFLRASLIRGEHVDPGDFCHYPIVVRDDQTLLGQVLGKLKMEPGDETVRPDVILLWGDQKRIITGGDIFGFLMRGIARRAPA